MPIQRTLKNIVKNYSDIERKVREATSNDPWGPASHLMAELSDMSYNVMAFTEIMQMLWKRLNEKQQRHWRHIFKALLVIEYLIKTGSEKVATQCRENSHCFESLLDFQYVEDGRDHGHNIRVKAKDILELLRDPQLLAAERVRAMKAKERLSEQLPLSSAANGSCSSSAAGVLASPARYSFRRIITGKDPTAQGFSTLNKKEKDYTEEEKMMRILQNLSEFGMSDLMSPYKRSKTKTPASTEHHAPVSNDLEAARPRTQQQEEEQLRVALAISREEHERESRHKQEQEVEVVHPALQHSRHASPTLDEPQVRPASSGTSIPLPSKLPEKSGLNPLSNPKSTTSSTSSRTGSISKSSWDPSAGAKLFDLVDTSLSVAPANAPHPWGMTSPSPSHVSVPVSTCAFPIMDAWGECTPVVPATPVRTLPPFPSTRETLPPPGGEAFKSKGDNLNAADTSLFDEFSGLVNLNELSKSASPPLSSNTNPFATSVSNSSQPNPFLESPDKTFNAFFTTNASNEGSDLSTSTLPPLPSRQTRVASSTTSGIHPNNPWYPLATVSTSSIINTPQHVIAPPFRTQLSPRHQSTTNPFLQ